MTREDPQLKIRLPDLLKERIADAAKQVGRSMNTEIVWRLESSFTHGDNDGTLGMVATAQSQTLKLLGYSLMMATTYRDADSEEVTKFKQDLRRISICLHNDELQHAGVAAAELALKWQAPVPTIRVTLRGKEVDTGIPARSAPPSSSVGKKQRGSANKIIIVDNLGRDTPSADALQSTAPVIKGPVRSPNARKPKF